MNYKFLYGDYKGKTAAQAALTDYKGYLFVKESIGKGWFMTSQLEDVVRKLNNFVPAITCQYASKTKCNSLADYLSIIESRGKYEDTYKNKEVEGLIGISVSPAYTFCENHKDFINAKASLYPIKFDILEIFNKRNKKNCYDIQQGEIEKIFKTLKACAGFHGKATPQYCDDFIQNLPQKQIIRPIQLQTQKIQPAVIQLDLF